jgi:NADH-quinone oxidoreductase subunit L
MGASTGIMIAMVAIAYAIYRNGPQGGEKFATMFGAFYRLVRDKWRIDELYGVVFVKPIRAIADNCYEIGDTIFVEGIVNGLPRALKNITQLASDLQGGFVRTYAKFMYLGIIALAAIIFWSFV